VEGVCFILSYGYISYDDLGEGMGEKTAKILGVIALALVLRLVVINQSYWLDEAIGLEASRDFGYPGIVSDFLKSDNHPPLYYLNLKLWNGLFGFSEAASRSLSVLYGIGTVFVTYLIGLELFGKGRTAIIAAVFLATSQFHIYYSQEARMYTMAGFFVALAFYAFLKIMRAGTHWLVFSLSLLAMMFTDYMPVFMMPVFWLLAIINKKDKAWWAKFVACHVSLVLLGLLWMPILQVQLKGGAWLVSVLPGWTSVAGGATLKQLALVWMKFVLGRVSLINKTTYYLLIFVASIPALYLLAKSVSRKSARVWLWFVLPLGLGFVASFVFPAFVYFRFVYVLPALYLLLASGVDRTKNWREWLIVILLVNAIGVSIYYLDDNQQREQWREAVAYVGEKIGQDEIVLFSYPDPFTPFRWYWGEKGSAFGAFEGLDSTEDQTRIRTGELVSDKAGVYYFEYLSDITDPKGVVEARIAKEMRLVGENRDFAGVGGIYYWRRE